MKKSSTLMAPIFMLTAALGLAAVLLSHAAAADETGEAEDRFKKGLMLVDEGDCKNAVVEFEESYRLFPAPVVLYNLALCYDDLHQYSKSMKYYKQFMTDAENLTPSQNKSIMDRIKKLEKYLGILEINCNIDGASVLIDDEDVGTTPMEAVYVETGQHKLTIRKPDYEDFVKKIKMVSGSTMSVDAELKPAEVSGGPGGGGGEPGDGGKKTKKKLKPVVFFSMLGATLALGAGAAVVGGLNIKAHNDFLDTPYSDSEKWKDLKDKGEMYNIIFLSLIGVTGAALVTTAVLAAFTDFSKLKKEKKPKTVEVGFLPGPGGAAVTLRFPLSI
jgi:hypothetical protein